MQWLIDIAAARVIAEIGIPPTFIDRGDPAAYDFTQPNFVYDGAWHNLDLSAIVPSNAVGVVFYMENQVNATGTVMQIRKKDNANDENIFEQRSQVANVFHVTDGVCPIGTDGLLEYLFSAIAYTTSNFAIKGWWL